MKGLAHAAFHNRDISTPHNISLIPSQFSNSNYQPQNGVHKRQRSQKQVLICQEMLTEGRKV